MFVLMATQPQSQRGGQGSIPLSVSLAAVAIKAASFANKAYYFSPQIFAKIQEPTI
jgi:hypothetical protein